MGSYGTRCLVLKARDFDEADRVLLLLSEDYGKFEALVKGARRPRSRFIGNTMPFNLLNTQFFPGKSLDQLSQAELVYSFSKIREDLIKMAYASYWVELVAEFLPEREPELEIFRFVLAALITLEQEADPAILSIAVQLRLLNYLGYQPHLDDCVNCGKSVGPRVIYFSTEAGGVLCSTCATQLCREELRELGVGQLALLLRLATIDIRKLKQLDVTGIDLVGIRGMLVAFIEARLNRPLKSQLFLESVLA